MKIAFRKMCWFNPIDLIIALFSCGTYTHVEIVFSDGSAYSSAPFEGTRYKNILFDDSWKVIDIHVSDEHEKIIRSFCTREIGFGYDWWGTLSFGVPWLHQKETKWFCTEVIIAAFQKANYLTCLDRCKTSPSSLERHISANGLSCRKYME